MSETVESGNSDAPKSGAAKVSKKRRRPKTVPLPPQTLQSREMDPSRAAHLNLLGGIDGLFAKAVEDLDHTDRAIYIMYRRDKLLVEDIAVIMRIKESSVESVIKRIAIVIDAKLKSLV